MLSEQITDFINACFTGLWVQTHEPDEAEREIVQHARGQRWKIAAWDIANGLRVPGNTGGTRPETGGGDPLAALRALPTLAEPNGTSILILHHFHRFLQSAEVVQTLASQLLAGKQQRTFVIVLSPIVQIPVELEKLMVVIEHPLPDREQLHRIARELMTETPDDLPEGLELQRVLDAAAGLTHYEAEGAFALSLARHSALRPPTISEIKSQTIKKGNLPSLHRGGESFADLGGLQALKEFCLRALSPRRSATGVKPRGLLLLSPPGCGKSAFCKALGNEVGRPTLILDIGALMASLVGQSEANLRQAPGCPRRRGLFPGDSGVSSRLFGTLLTYLSDHESDVFFIATSNDISKLPPELARAERFDGVFFLDLPVAAEKDQIWSIHRRQFGIAENQTRPDDTAWSGAEIKSCCRLAALLDVPLTQAARNVVPVAVTASDQVERLRSWASGRCLSASAPGIFARDAEQPARSRRVNRGPSSN
jgi:hypothetical protein